MCPCEWRPLVAPAGSSSCPHQAARSTVMPISPNQGSTGGGTLVTITGTNLS
ncbi:IPT/TIG domain-containing protein, partial [Streptomyces sp. NPDC052015]|uniref:IPT/TIG domain-containing protein n=1 Tax=Streptomyces sp. NPDC052015 TaxID=3154755 RepID=UPI003440EF98